jgi:hypothetical protein
MPGTGPGMTVNECRSYVCKLKRVARNTGVTVIPTGDVLLIVMAGLVPAIHDLLRIAV